MKLSQLLAPTLREVPSEAEIVSHQLMLRSGMIRKVAGGVYAYLPLAWRTLRKIEQIVREEMDAKGGQELVMPLMQPADIWRETGRWDVYGEEMFKLNDRHQREFCLGPTHEEMITTLVRSDVRSYKQLPLLLYQINNKYRDEIRPRFGLMRGREFVMKDLYSFDRDNQGLDQSYRKMYDAYSKIFERAGLKFRVVEADSGAIGGSDSHEFMVIAETGEAELAYCDGCNYGANVEKAECATNPPSETAVPLQMQEMATPDCHTIDEVSHFLRVLPEQTLKTLLYQADDKVVAVLVRGDHEVNEIKLSHVLNAKQIALASITQVQAAANCGPGSIGPVGLSNVHIVADHAVMCVSNVVCGANKPDMHLVNVNVGRDFNVNQIADIRLIQEGDQCPSCHAKVKVARGIEVGHIFKLGTKYSEALKATFLDENGKDKPFIMGCYGIGVSRVMAAAIEQNHDENGIIWPAPIAPFQVLVVPVNAKDEGQLKLAEQLYEQLNGQGIDTALDDRNERPGVKFKDADLIGYPLRITVGPKTLQEQKIEVKVRKTGEVILISQEGYMDEIKLLLKKV